MKNKMKYFVVATRWDDDRKAKVKFIAGEFNSPMNANIFKDAYNEFYKANAVIVEEFTMINPT